MVPSVGGALCHQSALQSAVVIKTQQRHAVSDTTTLHSVDVNKRIAVPVPGTESSRNRRLRALRQSPMTHRQLLGMGCNKLPYCETD